MTITPSRSGSIFGHSVKRTEDKGLITGAESYTGDLPIEGSLHVVFVRSPMAHGTLNSVDVEEARTKPGVVGVYVDGDLQIADRPGLPGVVPEAMSRPHLARGGPLRRRHLAAVVADPRPGARRGRAGARRHRPAAGGGRHRGGDGRGRPGDLRGARVERVAGAGTGEVEGIFDSADTVVSATSTTSVWPACRWSPTRPSPSRRAERRGHPVAVHPDPARRPRRARRRPGPRGGPGPRDRAAGRWRLRPEGHGYLEYPVAAPRRVDSGAPCGGPRPARRTCSRWCTGAPRCSTSSSASSTTEDRRAAGRVLGDAGMYPASGRSCRPDPADVPGRLRHPGPRVRGRDGGHQHHYRPAPTAAPGAPRRPSSSSASSTWPPTRSAWTRSRCAGRTSCSPTSSR